MPKIDHNSPERKTYTEIFDMISAAKNYEELERAALKAEILIKQNNLDDYMADKLQDHGINQFNKIQKQIRDIEYHRTYKKK